MMDYFIGICIFLGLLYVGLSMQLGEVLDELKKIRMILEEEAKEK